MANYVLLERIELNASAASVTFSNIPQTGYTDLKVVMSGRTTESYPYAGFTIAFNGSSTGFTGKDLYGIAASGAGSANRTTIYYNMDGATATANTFSNIEMYIPNYTSSNYKSFSMDGVSETNTTDNNASLIAGLWSNTAAITSVTIAGNSSSLVQYSTFSLYGLAAVGTTPAIAPKASGGNITTDGTYWYHTFLASGTFTPQTTLSCDALVVAGGGGGGGVVGGGGGAGGLLGFSAQSISTATTVTVGSGGAGGTNGGSYGSGGYGTNGNDSQLGALTLVKGGGGGAPNDRSGFTQGLNGGSGGGGGSAGATNGTGGTATSGQGQNGGASASDNNTYRYTGGGGGAGNTGSPSATSTRGGIGGAGSSAYSSWGLATTTGQNVSGTVFYAGGGGAGQTAQAGGNGGGASGGTNAGTVNTGGGGGGSSAISVGGAGGSGIVIIRYTIA